MVFFFVLYLLASAILFFSLSTAINLFKIKSGDAFLSRLISAIILVCCLYLSARSVLLFAFYGAVVSFVNLFFFSPQNATLKYSAIAIMLSFLLWPQFLCFFVFAIMFADEIAKSDFFKDK